MDKFDRFVKQWTNVSLKTADFCNDIVAIALMMAPSIITHNNLKWFWYWLHEKSDTGIDYTKKVILALTTREVNISIY